MSSEKLFSVASELAAKYAGDDNKPRTTPTEPVKKLTKEQKSRFKDLLKSKELYNVLDAISVSEAGALFLAISKSLTKVAPDTATKISTII